MKQDTGIAMELDDVKGGMDHRDDKKVDVKIKLDNIVENSKGISFDDGMDVDSVFSNRENGLKSNDAMLDSQSMETVFDNGSRKATIVADEVPETVEGGADVVSTSCGNVYPVSSCVTEFVECAAENKDVGDRVVSMNNASANENKTSKHSDLVTNSRLGIGFGGEIHEIHDQDAYANVSAVGSTISQSHDSLRHDTNTHEQLPFPNELPSKLVNKQLKCDLGPSIVCLEKDTANGLAQGVSKVVDIPDTQRQAANVEEFVSINAASARKENVTELRNNATSIIVDTQLMQTELEMDREVNTSTPIQDTEATDVFIDVNEVMNSCTAPKQHNNEECEGCVADEQHLLLDEQQIERSIDKFPNESTESVSVKPHNKIEVQIPQQAEEDALLNSENPQSNGVENSCQEASHREQVNLPAEQVGEEPVCGLANLHNNDERNAKNEYTPTQQVESLNIAVPTNVVLTEKQEVDANPVSDSANLHNMNEENATHVSTSGQQDELPETAGPIQHIGLLENKEDGVPFSDPEIPQSNDQENAVNEPIFTQHAELPEASVPTQQVDLPEEQVDEGPVSVSVNPQSMNENNASNKSTSTQHRISLERANFTRQIELPEEQKVEDTVSNSANPQNMDEDYVKHESAHSQQEMQLPDMAVSTQKVELADPQRVEEGPVFDSASFHRMDEDNIKHESASSQREMELTETAVPAQQVDLPEEQVNEDLVSDPANPQSIDESNASDKSTIQHSRSPETAVFTQQIELPEEQKVEDIVSVSANPQNIGEDNARNEYTPSQRVNLPETDVPAQSVELRVPRVDEGPVFDSERSQSMDENNVKHESASSLQAMDLPNAAIPTQQVELAEEQEKDPVSDSLSPHSLYEDNTKILSIPVQQVNLSEATFSSQPVEFPGEQEVDEDILSDSENPQRMDVDDAGNGSTFTQQFESPEIAPKVDECPVLDSAYPPNKVEKHVATKSTPQQVKSPGTVVSTQQVELLEEKEADEDCVSDSAKPRSRDERRGRRRSAKPGGSVSNHRVTYWLPPDDDSVFSAFDLVWGKVKSHPWWPGQIFNPSDSSEKALKYYKKDCYLVAYFGDRSFAWNDASVLKSFRKHFSQEVKQSTTESFQNAVKCALSEVSRRVELGLACSCISEEAYDKIKYQIVENGGIREELSKRESTDRSSGLETFHPDKLVEYVRALATSPTSGTDRLDLAIAKAQLLAFNRLKGCDTLAEFRYFDGLTEFDANSLPSEEKGMLGDDDKAKLKRPHKRKHNLKDIVYQRRKEKSLTELMGESMYYFDGEFDSQEEDDIGLTSPRSGSKRKALGSLASDFTTPPSTNPQQSFKVGECIRRVASQLTGTSSIMKCTSDGSDSKVAAGDAVEALDPRDDSMTESAVIPQKQSSLEEMMSQLHLSALDPMKGYSFLGDVISFFYEFRNTAVSIQRQKMKKKRGRKRKDSAPAVGLSPEAFEFGDKNDSYWTNMVVQKDSEAKPSRRGRKRKENQVDAVDSEKPKRRKYTKKQYFHESHEPSPEVPARDEKQDQLPTDLMLNFGDVGLIPSEVNLIKMFRRFGPLKESETEIDAESGRARLVFKKRSDAEVAYSSATMFNVFGSLPVIYELKYTPSAPFGTSPLVLTNTVEHGT